METLAFTLISPACIGEDAPTVGSFGIHHAVECSGFNIAVIGVHAHNVHYIFTQCLGNDVGFALSIVDCLHENFVFIALRVFQTEFYGIDTVGTGVDSRVNDIADDRYYPP